jgi:hypothetical protein
MDIRGLVRRDFPVTEISFLEGFNLFGSLFDRPTQPALDPDAEAIERDWEAVGADLQMAMDRFATQER